MTRFTLEMPIMQDSADSDASHESSPAASPAAAPSSSSKLPLAKDRECQYCHQAFTSSSLGRHLDQFIHKKKPDGIHDVDEIRRNRGVVTRRTNKKANKGEGEEGEAAVGTNSPMMTEIRADLNATPPEGFRVSLNTANWQSTGVINGLPNVPSASAIRPAGEAGTPRPVLGLRGDGSENDTARALELALKEVLDTIRAARTKTTQLPSPFPVEIPAQTFCALVIQLLPTPPTLLTSVVPFPTATSIPLTSPPDQSHQKQLKSAVIDLVTTWRASLLPPAQAVPSSYPTDQSYRQDIMTKAEYHTRTALDHIELAYTQFAQLPLKQKSEIWQIELARAFASERQKRKKAEDRLEGVMAESRQLTGQVEMISRYQWPREMALWPPERRPIGKHILREMEQNHSEPRGVKRAADGSVLSANSGDEGSDNEDNLWSFDGLLKKWKTIVQEDRTRTRRLIYPEPATLPPTPIANPSTPLPGTPGSSQATGNGTRPSLPLRKSGNRPGPKPKSGVRAGERVNGSSASVVPVPPASIVPGNKKPRFYNGRRAAGAARAQLESQLQVDMDFDMERNGTGNGNGMGENGEM